MAWWVFVLFVGGLRLRLKIWCVMVAVGWRLRGVEGGRLGCFGWVGSGVLVGGGCLVDFDGGGPSGAGLSVGLTV